MNTQEPKCVYGYVLDKEKCMCVKKPKTPTPVKQTKTKRTRCPKGTRKNKKTGICEPHITQSAIKSVPDQKPLTPTPPKVHPPKVQPPKVQPLIGPRNPSMVIKNQIINKTVKKRTRCPKGTRKNLKTGKCESTNTKTATKTATKRKEQPMVIPSSTPADITELSRHVSKHIQKNKPISPEKMTEFIKSFSPSIHARLEQLNSSPVKGKKSRKGKLHIETNRNQMLDCLDEHVLISRDQLSDNKREQEKRYDYTYLYDKPMPKIFVDGRCYPGKNMKSQKLLLKSLNESIKGVNMTNLVTPKQYASNCWFNSFFVVFFIGDKGRKFSKSLRHMMITQRGPGEKTIINNLNMRKTMFALNLAIEASLTGNPMAYKLNTNSFVVSLADSMPSKYKKKMPEYDKASNPLTFYNGLMDYFEKVHNIKGISITKFYVSEKNQDLNLSGSYKAITDSNSDLVIIEITDSNSDKYNKSKEQVKPLKINYHSKEYTLGATVIRDTKQRHFCCVCDVNGKEYGFDGASFRRLNPFEWRKLLNKDKTWTFEGSDWIGGKDDGKSILWNFMNGYQILFYYRTK